MGEGWKKLKHQNVLSWIFLYSYNYVFVFLFLFHIEEFKIKEHTENYFVINEVYISIESVETWCWNAKTHGIT